MCAYCCLFSAWNHIPDEIDDVDSTVITTVASLSCSSCTVTLPVIYVNALVC